MTWEDPDFPVEEWVTRTGVTRRGHRCQGRSKRAQDRCDRYAAKGQRVCKIHGGGTRASKQKGAQVVAAGNARREARLHAERAGLPGALPVRDPLTALANLAGEVLALNEFLRLEVERLNGQIAYWTETSFSDADGQLRTTAVENVRAVVGAYERSLDRGVKVLGTMVKLDLQGRLVTIREDEAGQLRDAILRGLGDVDMPQALRDGVQAAISARLEQVAGPVQTSPAQLPA